MVVTPDSPRHYEKTGGEVENPFVLERQQEDHRTFVKSFKERIKAASEKEQGKGKEILRGPLREEVLDRMSHTGLMLGALGGLITYARNPRHKDITWDSQEKNQGYQRLLDREAVLRGLEKQRDGSRTKQAKDLSYFFNDYSQKIYDNKDNAEKRKEIEALLEPQFDAMQRAEEELRDLYFDCIRADGKEDVDGMYKKIGETYTQSLEEAAKNGDRGKVRRLRLRLGEEWSNFTLPERMRKATAVAKGMDIETYIKVYFKHMADVGDLVETYRKHELSPEEKKAREKEEEEP